jgi:hypothetical protein
MLQSTEQRHAHLSVLEKLHPCSSYPRLKIAWIPRDRIFAGPGYRKHLHRWSHRGNELEIVVASSFTAIASQSLGSISVRQVLDQFSLSRKRAAVDDHWNSQQKDYSVGPLIHDGRRIDPPCVTFDGRWGFQTHTATMMMAV